MVQIALSASEMAVAAGGSPRGLNLGMLGAAVAGTKFLKAETVEKVLAESLGHKKPEHLESNLASFRAGLAA